MSSSALACPVRRRRTWPRARSRASGARPAGRAPPSACRSSSAYRSPPGSGAARPTRPRRCASPGRPPGSATRPSWPRSRSSSAPTCRPRSRQGAGSQRERASGSVRCRRRAPIGVLVLPLAYKLSTAAVYAESDRLEVQRERRELDALAVELAAALGHGAPLPAASELLHNDLQRAAVSLCPQIAEALGEARAAGAELALVSGSGPTALGLFPRAGESSSDGPALALHAARALAGRVPGAVAAVPVAEDYGRAGVLAGSS